MTTPIRPRVRLTRQQYDAARAEGYSDDEIAQDYDLPTPQTGARTATGILGKFAQGISMGTADEIGGAILSAFAEGKSISEKYRNARDIVRGVLNDAQEKAPTLSTLAEVGGAIAPAFVGAGTLIPRAAGAGLRNSAMRGAANVAEGALMGAASGAGNAEGGLSERVIGAGRGAVVGGASSGAFGAAAPAVTNLTRAVIPAITRRGVARAAARIGADALEASGLSADDIAARIANPALADKPLTLMEHMGTAGRKAARGARTTSSSARQVMDDLATDRMPGAGERVLADVREGLDIPATTPTRAANEAAAARTAIHAQEFTPPRLAEPVPTTRLGDSPAYRDAYDAIYEASAMRPGGAPHAPLFADDGALARTPTVGDIEAIRQGLADALESGRLQTRNRLTGRLETTNVDGELRRSLSAAYGHLMDDPQLERAAPWYRGARAALEEQHQLEGAIPTGHAMPGRDPMEIADAMHAMPSDAARRGARVGYAAKVGEQLVKAPPVSAADKLGGVGATAKTGVRQGVMAMAPDAAPVGPITPGQARLGQRLDAESEIAATQRFLSGQSETADKGMEALAQGARVMQQLRGITDPVRLAGVWLDAQAHGNWGRVSQEVARRFGSLNRAEQQEFLQLIAREALRRTNRGAVTGRVGAAAAGALNP